MFFFFHSEDIPVTSATQTVLQKHSFLVMSTLQRCKWHKKVGLFGLNPWLMPVH